VLGRYRAFNRSVSPRQQLGLLEPIGSSSTPLRWERHERRGVLIVAHCTRRYLTSQVSTTSAAPPNIVVPAGTETVLRSIPVLASSVRREDGCTTRRRSPRLVGGGTRGRTRRSCARKTAKTALRRSSHSPYWKAATIHNLACPSQAACKCCSYNRRCRAAIDLPRRSPTNSS